ncbi:hypothetical protein FA95DRAFT_1580619 [Auriscalpium vulgare]|uniref:Uncharacterized protein n=1 Tax=Auriscalpium vulgare TaxID=40419 RepID=A0ACB8S689_9AGAM|nr:hypothetical protein FA95DRAFT_1580619 [Auriscalpium vulgare]
MSSDFHVSELSSPLVESLNALLHSLALPFVLETPLDLTPSLLLAVLESLLKSRLPIDHVTRESRKQEAKVQAMKIFLGVLQTDLVTRDVGLGDIDPQRLASGEWEETVFVAKLLCWLGRQKRLLPTHEVLEDIPERASTQSMDREAYIHPFRMVSPSTRSTLTNSMHSRLSIDGYEAESHTTAESVISYITEGAHYLPSYNQPVHPPRCIHEIEDPSFLLSGEQGFHDTGSGKIPDGLLASDPSYCGCGEPHDSENADDTTGVQDSTHSVRYDGYIGEVDTDLELRAFEARRAHRARKVSPQKALSILGDKMSTPPPPPRPTGQLLLTRHTSPAQHTLALLNERARLLSELASLESRR